MKISYLLYVLSIHFVHYVASVRVGGWKKERERKEKKEEARRGKKRETYRQRQGERTFE